MKRSEAVMLELVPLAMAAICVAYGIDVARADSSSVVTSSDLYTAGRVVAFLGAICIALFCTAATIIQQLLGRYNDLYRYSLPGIGYAVAVGTIVCGIVLTGFDSSAAYVAGHVVIGIGLITGCVSTVAAASTRFVLIPENSRSDSLERAPKGFTATGERLLIAVPTACAIAGVTLAIVLLADGGSSNFVAGHVVLGLAIICASLVALVASVARQVSNSYTARERRLWPWLVVFLGTVNLVWGLVLLIVADETNWLTPGWVMIGLSLVCFSILSKVLLLALVWRRTFALANRIPLIPVATALACLFLAAFLFGAADTDPNVAIPARVLVGLGAVCFTLFSIVSILESGTSG